MADVTPSRRIVFADRTLDTRNDEDSNHEGVTCKLVCKAADKHDNQTSNQSTATVEPGVEQRSVPGNVEELQPFKISECDNVKNERFHQEICDKLIGVFPDLCFVKAYDKYGNSMIVITQQTLMFHPPMGFTSRIQVAIRGSKYEVYVMMRKGESDILKSIMDAQELCTRFSVKSNYKFCPGIDPHHYRSHYSKAIRFNIATVRQMLEPFDRVDSVNCQLWYQPANNATRSEKSANEVQCYACKRLVTDLNCQRRQTLQESPSRKLKWQSSSSRARLKYMSPASQQKRRSNAQAARSNLIRKLKRYSEADVTLNDDQHKEMCSIVREISDEELEKVFLEGSEHSVGGLMKEIWYTDSKRQHQRFVHDQSKNSKLVFFKNYFALITLATRGNRWSMITIRIGKEYNI